MQNKLETLSAKKHFIKAAKIMVTTLAALLVILFILDISKNGGKYYEKCYIFIDTIFIYIADWLL